MAATSAHLQAAPRAGAPPPALTVITVLGGPVGEDGKPRAHLALRLDAALAAGRSLAAAGAAHRYLLTGGAVKSYGSAAVVTEAAAMARWLAENGVSADAVLLEEDAVCTLTNALFAKRLLLTAGLWGPSAELLLVTSAGHMGRAATCFLELFPAAQLRMAPASDPDPAALGANLAHEASVMRDWFPPRRDKLRKQHPELFLPAEASTSL